MQNQLRRIGLITWIVLFCAVPSFNSRIFFILPWTNRWCCWSTLTHRYIDDLFKRHTHLFVLIRQLKSSSMFLTLPLLQHSANIRLTIIVIVFDLSVLKIWCKRSKMLRQKVLNTLLLLTDAEIYRLHWKKK